MKAWREAASLILTAKKPWSPPVPNNRVTVADGESCQLPDWGNIFDYQILMLKRSSKSSFMPNAFVFPGGVISKADFAKEWFDLFQYNGVHRTDLQQFILEKRDRPLLMKQEDPEEAVFRDLAFRMTALRETFEESGILLHRAASPTGSSQAFTFPDTAQLETFRKKVHRDPFEMLKLYKDLDLVPDIWGLTEWSDWLTPTDLHEQGKRRFDTLFYSANLDSIPQTVLDQAEISAVEWTHAGSILFQYYRRQLWLAPPQVYELCRLLNFRTQDELKQFSNERHHQGCITWLPVRLQCDDGLLSILPGDSMYPVNPHFIGDSTQTQLQVFKGSLKDCEQMSPVLNRLVFKDNYDCRPKVTAPTSHGHVHPLEYHHFQTKVWSEKGWL